MVFFTFSSSGWVGLLQQDRSFSRRACVTGRRPSRAADWHTSGESYSESADLPLARVALLVHAR